MCTKISSPPSTGVIKPCPLLRLKLLTFPIIKGFRIARSDLRNKKRFIKAMVIPRPWFKWIMRDNKTIASQTLSELSFCLRFYRTAWFVDYNLYLSRVIWQTHSSKQHCLQSEKKNYAKKFGLALKITSRGERNLTPGNDKRLRIWY